MRPLEADVGGMPQPQRTRSGLPGAGPRVLRPGFHSHTAETAPCEVPSVCRDKVSPLPQASVGSVQGARAPRCYCCAGHPSGLSLGVDRPPGASLVSPLAWTDPPVHLDISAGNCYLQTRKVLHDLPFLCFLILCKPTVFQLRELLSRRAGSVAEEAVS